ncbi:SGNH/GDSL hydrolase family protein [Glycomyces harbinensis]|uniref:Lysophospholipase L1 n=1 Tax=Glycomyces harbinensis TaxID=58114 RepID=A0A1G7ACZ1_9ACTN|nr:SGNH/GDSL hydrolase family protein [Glycomyces harbinensis]SDE12640.1 Lysophospholipase L1 [Glycomyces harbinensis]
MTTPLVVFAGDSVTDCGRREDPDALGSGYVRLLAPALAAAGFAVANRGVSGDRVRDLKGRWDTDVAALRPTIVSVLIGVNDMWRRYDSGDPTSAADFAADYRSILKGLDARLVLVEPFLLPVTGEQEAWREDLDEKITAVRDLADEFAAVLVPADEVLNALGDPHGLAPDGVHPGDRGHEALAELWLAHTGALLEETR